jgi:predicted AlkP superfamily pyrophosphatase or phosphodiesterase
MRKRIFFTTVLLFILTSVFLYSYQIKGLQDQIVTIIDSPDQVDPYFDNVVIITWDGTNAEWFNKLIDNGTLANTRKLLDDGYFQTVRIISHRTSTDPGLATIESGYGADIHGIAYNMFGPGSLKLSIPDNYTISERLKETYGDGVKTGFFFSWATDLINDTYMNQEQSVDSTYHNMKDSIDYYFASENLSWHPNDTDSRAATFSGFSEEIGMYLSPVIRADFLGTKAANWVTNVTSERFYLRVHLTEPDQAGHGYGVEGSDGEITPGYMQSLIACDEAVGEILNVLENAGVMNKTLFLVGTDHGMFDRSHGSGPYPGIRLAITQTSYVVSNSSVQHSLEIPAAQMDIAPTVLKSMGVDISTLTPEYNGNETTGIPFWEKIDTEAPIIQNVKYRLMGETEYTELLEGDKILGNLELKLAIREWSYLTAATLTVDTEVYDADFSTELNVYWYDFNTSLLEEGNKTLHFSLTDSFGLTTTFDVEVSVSTTEPTDGTPISLWISLASKQIILFFFYFLFYLTPS